LGAFENKPLRTVFGPKTGGWKEFHNEELHMYSSSDIKVIKSRMIQWAGHLVCMGEMRNAYNILVGNPESNRPLRRFRCRRVDNINP
jgi:hypothetical protein